MKIFKRFLPEAKRKSERMNRAPSWADRLRQSAEAKAKRVRVTKRGKP